MRLLSLRLTAILITGLLLVTAASATTTSKKKSTHKSAASTQQHTTKSHAKAAKRAGSTAHVKSATSKSKHGKAVKKSSWKSHGQHGIDSDRTRQIQEALIREKYLDGEADGNWDARTQEAMRRYQQANGWQGKVLPDSRALIKLGLGPDHTQVLNPETAAVSPYASSPAGAVSPTSATSVPSVSRTIRDQN